MANSDDPVVGEENAGDNGEPNGEGSDATTDANASGGATPPPIPPPPPDQILSNIVDFRTRAGKLIGQARLVLFGIVVLLISGIVVVIFAGEITSRDTSAIDPSEQRLLAEREPVVTDLTNTRNVIHDLRITVSTLELDIDYLTSDQQRIGEQRGLQQEDVRRIRTNAQDAKEFDKVNRESAMVAETKTVNARNKAVEAEERVDEIKIEIEEREFVQFRAIQNSELLLFLKDDSQRLVALVQQQQAAAVEATNKVKLVDPKIAFAEQNLDTLVGQLREAQTRLRELQEQLENPIEEFTGKSQQFEDGTIKETELSKAQLRVGLAETNASQAVTELEQLESNIDSVQEILDEYTVQRAISLSTAVELQNEADSADRQRRTLVEEIDARTQYASDIEARAAQAAGELDALGEKLTEAETNAQNLRNRSEEESQREEKLKGLTRESQLQEKMVLQQLDEAQDLLVDLDMKFTFGTNELRTLERKWTESQANLVNFMDDETQIQQLLDGINEELILLREPDDSDDLSAFQL